MKRDNKIKVKVLNGTNTGMNKIGRYARDAYRHSRTKATPFKDVRKESELGKVFIGPSVEGSDKEYVKVLSGDVDRRKPSFA